MLIRNIKAIINEHKCRIYTQLRTIEFHLTVKRIIPEKFKMQKESKGIRKSLSN